jgi:hypothetical protein
MECRKRRQDKEIRIFVGLDRVQVSRVFVVECWMGAKEDSPPSTALWASYGGLSST